MWRIIKKYTAFLLTKLLVHSYEKCEEAYRNVNVGGYKEPGDSDRMKENRKEYKENIEFLNKIK